MLKVPTDYSACPLGDTVVYAHLPNDRWEYSYDPEGRLSSLPPFSLFLGSLGSCTGTDVLYVMNKKSIPVEDLWVKVSATRSKEPPTIATRLHVHYILVGEDIPADRVERAIKLSQEKYCPASGMVKAVAEITTSYEITTAKQVKERLNSGDFDRTGM